MGAEGNEGCRSEDEKENNVVNDQGNEGETTMNCIEYEDTDVIENNSKERSQERKSANIYVFCV